MQQRTRILIGVAILFFVSAGVLLFEGLRSSQNNFSANSTIAPGDIPIYFNGSIASAFSPADLETMAISSFIDAEEGKKQEGWLLKDVLSLNLGNSLTGDDQVIISSSSNNKSIQLSWNEVNNPENMVLFDLSGRGTLKLVSRMEKLDIRDEWIQDVDKIEVVQP